MTEQVATAVDGERETLKRGFTIADADGDGRTLSIVVVPFGEVATVADPPDFKLYREQWLPGVFRPQEGANAHRVLLTFEHDQGLGGIVGRGISLREETYGYVGEFRFLKREQAEVARELVQEGVLHGGSVEFRPKRSLRTREGIVQRALAHLDKLTLTRRPAFRGSTVLALREGDVEDEIIVDAELLPVEMDRELLERCRNLGVTLPQRYQAPPDLSDTSADADPSDDGTRQNDQTVEVEES